MKKIFYYLIVLFSALYSCSRNNMDNLQNISYLVLSGKSLDIVPTKANINLPQDTRLGVYVLNVTSGSVETFNTAKVKNKQYTVTSEGTFTGDILYINSGKDYDIYSYAPIVDPVENINSIVFNHGTDLIWSEVNRDVRGALPGQNTANLKYYHKTSQIRFTLTDDRDNTSKTIYPFSGALLEVSGFCSRFYLDLENGEITKGPIDNNVKIRTQDSPVCFASDARPMSLNVFVNIPGVSGGAQTYSGRLTNSFLQGYSYNYNIKLTSTALVMTGTITDWITVPVEDFIILPD